MKFGQLIEWNMRNIFLKKSYTKWDGKTNPRTFSEKLKLSMSLDGQSEHTSGSIVEGFIEFVFIVCQAEGY